MHKFDEPGFCCTYANGFGRCKNFYGKQKMAISRHFVLRSGVALLLVAAIAISAMWFKYAPDQHMHYAVVMALVGVALFGYAKFMMVRVRRGRGRDGRDGKMEMFEEEEGAEFFEEEPEEHFDEHEGHENFEDPEFFEGMDSHDE